MSDEDYSAGEMVLAEGKGTIAKNTPVAGDNGQVAGSKMTPLWVISLFVSLCEVVAGLAVTQAEGAIAIILAIFVVLFPMLVAGAFFATLWFRPGVLYAPSEFAQGANVEAFVSAMHRNTVTEAEVAHRVEAALKATNAEDRLKRVAADLKFATTEQREVRDGFTRVLDQITEDAIEEVRRKFISIDIEPITGVKGDVRYFPFTPERRVQDLLDSIWAITRPYIKAFTYGQTWVLTSVDTGKDFPYLGRNWKKSAPRGTIPDERQLQSDERYLEDVGFRAGMRLRARYIEAH
ncbi:MAG: hypothetical protein AAGF11_13085 [Myxococcota bacterium]